MAARGSEQLMDHWRTIELDDTLIKKLTIAVEDLRLIGVLTKGTPLPDVLRAEFVFDSDDPERCGTVIGKILGTLGGGYGLGHVRVFPKGIPVIDRFHVNVEIGGY